MRPPTLLFLGLAALALCLAPVAAPAQSPIPPPLVDPNAPEPIYLDYRPWITVTLPRVGVAIDLPAQPKLEGAGSYTIHGSGFMISVSASRMPDLTPEQLRKTAETSAGYGCRILSTESFAQAGVAGVEARFETAQGEQVSHSAYSHKGRLYQVVFIVGKGGSLSPSAERPRTSLRFLDAPEP